LSQASMSPSSLPPEESSHSYEKGKYFFFNFILQDIEPIQIHLFFFHMCACICRFSCFVNLLYCSKYVGK
jgi:hypothetical protein